MNEIVSVSSDASATEYKKWITDLKARYRRQQIKAAMHVNSAQLAFYWSLGKDIEEKQFANVYGSGFIKKLSADLECELPGAKCFSPTNLGYIRRFHRFYSCVLDNHPQVGGKSGSLSFESLFAIPWGHHKYILDKCHDDPEKAIFYIQKTLENNWSRDMLLNFIGGNLYERNGKAISNFKTALPVPQGDLAQQLTKDPYTFDFLDLREEHDEKELKDALVGNITRFLMELGSGFAFVGREYRLSVDNDDYYIDLLFYNVKLHAYVVIEVKTGKFNPKDLGQLGFYVSTVNNTLKSSGDNPTIGLLLCKTKSNLTARYALESSNEPIGISEYEFSKLYPTDWKSSLPTIEEIERELGND